MDWVLALCIATAVITGLGLLFVIAFASGEDSVLQSHTHEVAIFRHKITELENECNAKDADWVKVETERLREYLRAEDLQARLKESESIRSSHAYHIRELAKELRDIRMGKSRGKKDFAVEA